MAEWGEGQRREERGEERGGRKGGGGEENGEGRDEEGGKEGRRGRRESICVVVRLWVSNLRYLCSFLNLWVAEWGEGQGRESR